MKIKDPNQRYIYFFRYVGGNKDDKPVYTTMAYSLVQALKQLHELHKNANIYNYYENNAFDITREPYIPKEKKPEPKKGYEQLSFKGFTDS